jgi:hypothetical protein
MSTPNQEIPSRELPPTRIIREDDVMRQPGTLAVMLLAVGIIVGLGFMYLGTSFGPSSVIETDPAITSSPAPGVQ